MATDIAQKTCTPCRGGVPPLTPEEASDYLSQTPGWELLEEARLLRCKFKFADFQNHSASSIRSADWQNERDIILTSASAGVTPQSRCRLTRSRACTKTISSWQRRSISWQVGREALGPSDR